MGNAAIGQLCKKKLIIQLTLRWISSLSKIFFGAVYVFEWDDKQLYPKRNEKAPC